MKRKKDSSTKVLNHKTVEELNEFVWNSKSERSLVMK